MMYNWHINISPKVPKELWNSDGDSKGKNDKEREWKDKNIKRMNTENKKGSK